MSGIIKELIKSPFIKGMIRRRLKEITPEEARSLVRTILWQDIEVVFGVMGALPSCINAAAAAMGTLAHELKAKVSPEMSKGFAMSIIQDIDTAIIKDSTHALAELSGSIIEASPELKNFIIDKLPGIIATGINSTASGINKLCKEDPALIGSFVNSLAGSLDKQALNEATLNITEAFLDTGPGLAGWTLKLIKRRASKRFKRTGK
ncbi:MAG TPA: hypothetical protein VIS94_00265 [Desulfomonilia bacterium]